MARGTAGRENNQQWFEMSVRVLKILLLCAATSAVVVLRVAVQG